MSNRVTRKLSVCMGKKKFRCANDAFIESQYMSSCCNNDTIRTQFTYASFASKRQFYSELTNETAKSKFIDGLLQYALHINDNNYATFNIFVDGKSLHKNCLCHLYSFSCNKLDK